MPYNPLAQAELDQQRAEQNSAAPNASPEAQQAAAEHAVRQQQAYQSSPSHQASLAHAAQREAEKAQQTALEGHYRSQGIPTWTGADGNLYPDTKKLTDQAAKEQERVAKDQAAADKAAATLAAKQQRATAIRSERRHRVNPVDGTPIYLESEQDLATRQQTEAEKTRQAQLDAQIKAADSEHGSTIAKQAAEGIKPLTETARKKLAEKAIPQTKQEALAALQAHYQNLSAQKSGDADWIPFNESPTPEAQAAAEHLKRLQSPDADLTEEDLATLAGNDATKPLAARLQNQQGMLSKDDELQKLKADHAVRVADLKLRRDAPDKWTESVRARRAAMSPEELKAELEASGSDLDARTAALQQQATSLNEQVAAHTQQLDTLAQQAEQRRQQGIPAGDLVSYQGADGAVEHWPKDLAAQREAIMARLQDTQSQQQSDWAALKAQEKELQHEATLHNEAAQLLQTTQKAKVEEAKKADLTHLQFTPGHEQTAQELAALDEESQSRLDALNEQYQGNPPPEALDALQKDIQQRSQSALAMGDSRRLAAQSAYAGIQQQVQEYQNDPSKKGDIGDLWINARKNLAEALQIPEAKAMQMLEDAEAETDWDKVLGRFQEQTPSGEWKSWRNALSDDSDPRKTRVLSNGGIVVNPSITDEAKYKAAVEAAKASPEAKAAALARYPQIRQRQGQNVLDTLKEIEGTFGADTLKDWQDYAKQRPKDVSEQDWALKFSEKLKADTAASPFTSLLKQVTRSAAQGIYDLRQQGSGFIAGITGSETAMQDAQWAGRKAEALGATKELEGTVGKNFISRGVFDQLPRLAGSILPAAGGAKIAQGGIKLFAATSLGARLLPSLASALAKSSTPAQAVKAVQTLTRAGLGGTAAAAGVQTYGSQLADIYGTLRRENPELTHQQALSAAQQPAILSAAVTALLTTAGGAHGLEKLLVTPAAAKELFKKQFTSQLQRAGFLGAAFAKGAGKELLEELPDELFSQYQAAVASHPKDPQAGTKAIAQFMQQLPELSVAIGLLGGGGEAISDSQGTSVTNGQQPATSSLPETQAAADAAIQNHIHRDANGVEVPEFTQAIKQRAALALATARGGDLFDATEKQLNAAGWTRRDSQGRDMPPGKFSRLKDYTGPNVLNIDTAGRAHIDPAYLTSLKETLPAVAAAIPDAATQPSPVNEPTSTTDTSAAKSGNPPAGQTPANGPGPNANPSPVQAPAQSGAEPASSGSIPPQSGTPVTANEESVATPARSSTAVPTTEQSIADWLVDRHMPDAEAAAAAKAITSHPDMAGKDYDHFTRQITARDALLQSLGITGATSKKQAAANPLRFTIASVPATSGSDSGPSENSDNSVNPVQNSGFGSANPALPPSVQAALDDSIPGTPSQEVFDAIKKAVQAKELTEQAATTLVAQQSGALDHTELRQSLENKLGWNTTRANTAAALHFGDKSKSDIPLAAAERDSASNRVPSNGATATISGTQGPEPELATAPSALTQNDDYARAKLAALSRIKDPTKKSWARQLFALIEKTFEKHHLLYDALATGAVARKHLGGQFTAVMVIDGKVTRLIDLDAMVGQFAHIESPAAALRATGIEEDVHALVLQLSRKNPEKYGYPALVKKWKALPNNLKQTVWQSYNAATQTAPSAEGTLRSSKSEGWANLSSKDEWHMMNEFLRMLVQDAHFAGQITESVDAAPGLIQWVKDLLKDLGQILRSLLKDAPPALQKDIQSMVAELGQRLKDIEKPSAATAGTRLETIPTLADTQGITQQALTTLLKDGQGILSPAALARIWDQLDPALQKRVFAQKERTPRQTTLLKLPYTAATRAPNHELMQELLTLLLTDPAAAQSLLDTPKSTNLLAKLVSSLRSAIAPATGPSPEATTAALLGTLHAQTLRLLASITGTRFVQSLPPAVAQAITTAPPAVAAKIAASRIEPSPVSPAPVPASENPANSVNSVQNSGTPASAPEPIHPRAADFLAAIESAEKDHTDAANDEGQAKLRTKLRLQEVASIRAQFFLRDNAAREQHLATQSGRQDVEKATALQDLALVRIGQRRPASAWRTLGLTERRRLALLGIGVDQHAHTETGGYPYSLSRIESAEARVEFSLAGTQENQMAQEELDWMRQQPAEYQTALDPLSPAYVERDHVIIKQSALDDLALSYPHTAALIRPEWHTRQSYGLRVDARLAEGNPTRPPTPTPTPTRPRSEDPSNTQQPELPAQPPASGNPVNSSPSGSGIPLPLHSFAKNSGTEKPTKLPTFDVPVKGEGTITATFPDTASREAFQFKHDLARSRKLPSGSERTKLETSLSTLKARFMADLGLGDDAVTAKLAAYHEHVVAAAAEHAAKNRIGGITAPQFEAFSGGRSAPSTKSLPAPVGGDLIADLARYGIGRISSTVQPGKAGDMDWFKSVTDGTAGPHKQTALILAVKAADAGELTTPLARRIWLAGTAGLGLTPAQARWERPGHVLAPNGMPIDAAASTLSSQQADGSGTPYQFDSGDDLGLAILEALDSRIGAKGQSADPSLSAEADAQEQSRNFDTLISGNQDSGQSMTGAEIAAALDPDTAAENTLKLGTAWFTVDSQDDTGLHLTASGPDADLYGQQTLAPDQSYPVTQINDTPLVSSSFSYSSSSSERSDSPTQSPESLEAQRSALPTDQRDIFQRRALETIHRELPPEQLATPQDTAELQRDYQESVAAGESLDESTPDLDLDDDIAESGDAYLDGEPLAAAQRNPFYSALAEAIRAKMPARSTPATVVGILKNAGIKTEELKWTGILPWLQQQAQNGPITQQQVLDYLKEEGAIQLQEHRMGDIAQNRAKLNSYRRRMESGEGLQGEEQREYNRLAASDDNGGDDTKYSQYQLPGGTNYREVVLTMPGKEDRSKIPDGYQLVEGTGLKKWEVYGPGTGRYAAGQTPSEAIENFWDLHGKHHDLHAYASSHFQYIPNYVAHMRLNDLTDAAGLPGTFIEEIQSDRHQAGRKKGYRGELTPAFQEYLRQLPEAVRADALHLYHAPSATTHESGPYWRRLETAAPDTDHNLIHDEREKTEGTIPDAPFRTSWPLQMFKRALVDAVASGKAWIGWTTGDTQASRYDLSKQIKEVSYYWNGEGDPHGQLVAVDIKGSTVLNEREVPPSKLTDYIGKEAAEKLLKAPDQKGLLHLSGVDLKVGGEGMKGFYDTILPKEIGKYVKQWGAGVQQSKIEDTESLKKYVSSYSAWLEYVDPDGLTSKDEFYKMTEAEKIAAVPRDGDFKSTPIWRIDITPQMKAGVEAGQALFAAPRRAYESMTFDPPFHTAFGDILSYDWMNQPVGGLSSQRTSDWSRARTNPATGRDIVHHFKVQKPDGIHTVSLETALGQLTEPQRHKLQSLIKSEQRRREEAAAGQMTLFAAQRVDLSEAISAVEAFYADPNEPTNWPEDLQEDFENTPLSRAVEDTDFVAFYEALPENKRTKEFTQWYEEAKANAAVQERLEDHYRKLKKNPQALFTPDEWAALQAEPSTAKREILIQNRPMERAIQQLTIPERKIYDEDLENLTEFWESDKPQEMAMAAFLPQVKERVQSTIRQIEALGRHKWDKTMQTFDELDEPQVLFASQRQPFDLSRAFAPTTTQSGALTSLFNPRPGAPQNADPRRGYFPSTATPQLITQAYTAAARGQSSTMLPIRRVFEQAQALQPSLTPAAFLQAVKAADDSGQVLLEPYDTPAGLDAAQPFVLRNASGIPCVSMALAAAPRVTDPPFSTQESKTLENTRIHAIDTYLHGKRRPIANTPPADQAGSIRAQLQALLQHLRGSQRPGGPPAGNEQARIAEARRHDKTLLINWARNAGVLLSEIPGRYPLNSPQDKGGREHHVFHDTSNRWVKITKGDGSAFGFQPLDESKNDEWMISQDHADVVSYLEKLALQNQVFHDDVVLHGVIADPLGKVALIISQPHYKGTFAGVYTAIKPAMADAGFVRIEPPSARFEDPSAYYRPSDNLAVVDMHDQNAILEDNGTFLRVFDNIMLHPTGALRATFERLAAKRQALPAAQRVEAAAAETDPNPSVAQKAAGNYTKGKVTLHGLRLSIENPRGTIRSGTDATGKPWSVTMPHHYGYFLGTEGNDGDHVDFFLGPNPDSQTVLIVNQRKIPSGSGSGNPVNSVNPVQNSGSGTFDEHKIMLGFDSPAQAAKAYLSAYTPGWKGLQSAIPTTLPVLKEWLNHHDTTQPVTRENIAKVALAATLRTAQTPSMADSPQAAHNAEPSPGGLSEAEESIKRSIHTDLRYDYDNKVGRDAVILWRGETEFPRVKSVKIIGGDSSSKSTSIYPTAAISLSNGGVFLKRFRVANHGQVSQTAFRGYDLDYRLTQERNESDAAFNKRILAQAEPDLIAAAKLAWEGQMEELRTFTDKTYAESLKKQKDEQRTKAKQEILRDNLARFEKDRSALPLKRYRNRFGVTFENGTLTDPNGSKLGDFQSLDAARFWTRDNWLPESSRAEGGTLLPAGPRVESAARALDKSVTGLGKAANLIPRAVGKVVQGITGTGQYLPGNQALASFGTTLGKADAAAAAKVGTTVADALQRVSGKDIRKAPDAVAAWLGKPDGLGAWTKSTFVDQLLPTALMPREWLALSHEMQRKTAFGAEKSNDLIRALSGNPRLSDLAYPKEFAENMMYREQLFDAMENKSPWSSLPPAMQALGTKLRAMLRETGLELVKQGVMNPDTFEELQANGWMPRYMLEEAMESGGSVLAAFKLGVKDLMQQRSTAFHIVDTTRKGKDGQYLTVNRKEGGRNAWRFRDAATRDAFYSDFIRRQALDMLQETHGNTKELQTMMATLDGQQRREIRSQIKLLTRADMDSTQKLSPALAGMVKAAIEHQKSIYRKEAPFDPPKLIKDPVYSIARYILAQTHNAATMELLNETAKNKDWTSNVSLQGFTEIPDNDRFGPLAGKFVQKDIAQQILDKLDVPNAALRFYDAVLRKWKSGKLVWNPGSHIRDAVGNTVFAYLGGSNIANPGNWPYYRQALEIMRNGGPLYNELLEHGVLGGDAYSSLVRERLKGLLPDAKTVKNFNPGLLQRFFLDFGSKFHGTHEQLAEYRRMPDDFYKIAAYLKAKAEHSTQHPASSSEERGKAAAAHVRKWFPYYDRLGGSGFTRAAGRFVNPFLSFFRESTRILATAAAERPIALAAALAFPAAISALSAMLLGLDDRDRDEIGKDLAGRGKGILGLSSLHLFSMLLPMRSGSGQVQQFDISAIMPFADLLGQKIVPLEEKENAWQTFWRQTAAAGPIGNLGVSWITNRDLFSGRHLTEADMSTPEMISAYAQHAAGVALPPLAPDLAALVGIGDGGALARSGQRQTNKTLQTYDTTQTVIRSIFGMNVKSAAPNIYRQADDFRKAHGYDAQPDFDYGTTATSRAKRALVQQLAQDKPNPTAIKNLVKRLKDMGVPLDTPGAITKVLKIIDPASIIGGSRKQNLTAEAARQRFRQSLPPESRALYEASLQEYRKIQQRAPSLLRQAQ